MIGPMNTYRVRGRKTKATREPGFIFPGANNAQCNQAAWTVTCPNGLIEGGLKRGLNVLGPRSYLDPKIGKAAVNSCLGTQRESIYYSVTQSNLNVLREEKHYFVVLKNNLHDLLLQKSVNDKR